jgi:hypothetical protein
MNRVYCDCGIHFCRVEIEQKKKFVSECVLFETDKKINYLTNKYLVPSKLRIRVIMMSSIIVIIGISNTF